jgi:hypothetical protein
MLGLIAPRNTHGGSTVLGDSVGGPGGPGPAGLPSAAGTGISLGTASAALTRACPEVPSEQARPILVVHGRYRGRDPYRVPSLTGRRAHRVLKT